MASTVVALTDSASTEKVSKWEKEHHLCVSVSKVKVSERRASESRYDMSEKVAQHCRIVTKTISYTWPRDKDLKRKEQAIGHFISMKNEMYKERAAFCDIIYVCLNLERIRRQGS